MAAEIVNVPPSGMASRAFRATLSSASSSWFASTSAAGEGVTVPANLGIKVINSPTASAYPITSPTWILVYKNQTDATTGQALKTFLNFILTTGETTAAPKSDYAPLQGSLLSMAQAQVNNLVIP